jgi:hypothetical protein
MFQYVLYNILDFQSTGLTQVIIVNVQYIASIKNPC